MPAILDVAIGTVFIFLLFSLVVSALNEFLLSKFDQRAKFLHMGLQELFGETSEAKNIGWRKSWRAWLSGGLLSKVVLAGRTLELCEHGLINAFSRTDKPGAASPSYIPAGSFVTALLSVISKPGTIPAKFDEFKTELANKLAAAPNDPAELQQIAAELNNALRASGPEHTAANIELWIEAIPEQKLREGLRSLFLVAEKDVEKFKAAVEGWFNSAMDRVSGWYKRFAQKWMILIAFVLAAVLNVDTIHIVRELSTGPNLAKAVASQAAHYVKTAETPVTEERAAKTQAVAVANAQKELDAAKTQADATRIANAEADLAEVKGQVDAEAKFHAAIAKLSTTGIPIGWDDEQRRALGLQGKHFSFGLIVKAPFEYSRWTDRGTRFARWFSTHFTVLVALIAGWLLTAVAASMGAPFWFDTLNRFINLRNAGRPPGEADPTAKSTKPPPATLDKTPGLPATTAR